MTTSIEAVETNSRAVLPEYSSSGLSVFQLDLPSQERKLVLLSLTTTLREKRITDTQIQQLAEVLYQDSLNGAIRPFSEVCLPLFSQEGSNRWIKYHPVLSHTVLRYDPAEMEVDIAEILKPRKADEVPRGFGDLLAGGGPTRPLMLEMFHLEQWRLMDRKYDEKVGSTVFIPTYHGHALADAIKVIFEYNQFLDKHDVLIEIGQLPQRNTYYGRLTPKPGLWQRLAAALSL